MVKVIVPNPQYRGVIANVQFHNGVGEFEDIELAEKIAKQFGFEVIKEEIIKDQIETVEEKPVEAPKKTAKKSKKKAGE